MKLYRVKGGPHLPDHYQTEPKCGSGIGRFQVLPTDNSSARRTGRLPRWTVRDLYKPTSLFPVRFDTLAEVREWISREEQK